MASGLRLTSLHQLHISAGARKRTVRAGFTGWMSRPVHLSQKSRQKKTKVGENKARSTLATMSKQRSTLSKGWNFNAKLVRHCCRFWQQSRTLLRHCCWCGPGLTNNNERQRNTATDAQVPQNYKLLFINYVIVTVFILRFTYLYIRIQFIKIMPSSDRLYPPTPYTGRFLQ